MAARRRAIAIMPAQEALDHVALLLFATVPFGFLAGLLRTRLAHGAAVSELISRLGQAPGEDSLRTALAPGRAQRGKLAQRCLIAHPDLTPDGEHRLGTGDHGPFFSG